MYRWEDLGLCGGTLAGADFRTLVESAGAADFRWITLWPSHFLDALASGLSERDMRNLLADNGLRVSELDPFCAWLPIGVPSDDIAASFFAYEESDFFRIADALGARSLNVIQAADGGLSRREVVDALAGLCERARAHELIVTLEFMPWSPIGSLSDALAVVEAADQPNCGVNVDTWHHFRTGGTLADIARLEPSRVGAVQLNDVAAEPWEDLLAETAQNRQLPGQGVSDSGAVLEAFWNAGVRVPLNLEVFSARLQALAPREAARELAESMRALLPED